MESVWQVYQRLPVGRVPEPRGESGGQMGQPQARLWLRLERPNPQTAVIVVGGEVDGATAPRLEEMLHHRLRSELELVVLDLSGLDFLGVAGIHTLFEGRLRTEQAGTTLVVATDGNRLVERALTVTAEHHRLHVHPGRVADLLAVTDNDVEGEGAG